MERTTLALLSVLVAAGCATTKEASARAVPSESPMRAELAQLRAEVDRLSNKLGHLESEFAAGQAEGEFTTMTIDRVHWPSDLGRQPVPGDSPDSTTLYCHVVEWNGFGKMKRFTSLADRQFFLEAPGHATVRGHMAVGGITSSSGDTRLTVLRLTNPLEPGVEYTLRPRNEVEGYQWVMKPELRVPPATDSGA